MATSTKNASASLGNFFLFFFFLLFRAPLQKRCQSYSSSKIFWAMVVESGEPNFGTVVRHGNIKYSGVCEGRPFAVFFLRASAKVKVAEKSRKIVRLRLNVTEEPSATCSGEGTRRCFGNIYKWLGNRVRDLQPRSVPESCRKTDGTKLESRAILPVLALFEPNNLLPLTRT